MKKLAIFGITILFLTGCGSGEYLEKTKKIQEVADIKTNQTQQNLYNSGTQIDVTDTKKIPYGDFGEIVSQDDSDRKIKMKVSDISWKGKRIVGKYSEYDAKNEFLLVTLESENIGKKTNELYFFDTYLVTKDGYEYLLENTIELESMIEGFGGCISCEHNPGEKNREGIVFDITKIDITGAKLVFKDLGYEFLLSSE